MTIYEKIILELANKSGEAISNRVIRYLQGRNDCLLSGVDSGLKNSWDEVCVQVQYEQSVFWGAYEETVRSIALGYLTELTEYEKMAIWLQTDSGMEWSCKDENNDVLGAEYQYDEDEIAEYIVKEFLYAKASNWSNSRIRDYLETKST